MQTALSPVIGRSDSRAEGGWMPPPKHPLLVPRSVHVWRADLPTVSDNVLDSLSPDERERAARFVSQPRALQWGRARGVLRALLACYLEVEADAVQFRVDGYGKPHLLQPASGVCIAFNVSHSGPIALYAFTPAAAVGVDVQTVPARAINEVSIARRVLGTEASLRLAGLNRAARESHFLRAWTRREAALKCMGIGIGHGPSADAHPTAPGAKLWVRGLSLGASAAGALACSRQPRQVLQWTWRA